MKNKYNVIESSHCMLVKNTVIVNSMHAAISRKREYGWLIYSQLLAGKDQWREQRLIVNKLNSNNED